MNTKPNATAAAPILSRLLTAAFVIQTLHYAEHVAQVYQIYALGFKPAEARGLLGSLFDFEWVHFLYNVGLELALIALYVSYRRRTPWEQAHPLGRSALTMLVLVQGYHSVEHLVKLYQYYFVEFYKYGLHPTAGLLPLITGWPIFLVHFWLNTIVWTLIGLAWLGLRLPRRIHRVAEGGRKRLRAVKGLKVETVSLRVPTMRCEVCLNSILAALTLHPHVQSVQGDLSTRHVTVTFNRNGFDGADVEWAISKAGFVVG